MYNPIHEWQHLSDLVLTHVTVTSLHISCCAVHVVSKSLQQYSEYWFYQCLIISDLGSAVRYLHSYMGCPPTSALSSFHARNKLLRYAWKWKCYTGHWASKKEWADRTVRMPNADVRTSILFSIFSFTSRADRLDTGPTDRPQTENSKIIQKCYTEQLQWLPFNQFSNYPQHLSLWFILRYYCRSSATSPSSFLKFWRAASRNEMEQQLNDAPSWKLCLLESNERSQLFDHLSPSTRQ